MERTEGVNEDPGGANGGEMSSSMNNESVAGKVSSGIATYPSNTPRADDPKDSTSPRIQCISSSDSQGAKRTNAGLGTEASPVPSAESVEDTLKEESLKLPSSRKKGALLNRDRSTLRKGKWTVEEEEYTSRIIHFFNSGLLTLPEGYTLRSYLAEKLNCDPMRITKKYAGAACLGRRAYLYRDRPQPTITEIRLAKAQLDELEHRFRMRVEESYTGNPPPSTLDVLASLQQQAGNPVLSLSMSQKQQQQQQQQQQINSVAAIQTLLLSILGASSGAATQPVLSIPTPAPATMSWPNGLSLQTAAPAPSNVLPAASAPMGQWIPPQTGVPTASTPVAYAPAVSLPPAPAAAVPLAMARAPTVSMSSAQSTMPQNTQAPSMPVQNIQTPFLPVQTTQAPMPAQSMLSSSSAGSQPQIRPQIRPQAHHFDPSLVSVLELAASLGNVVPSPAAMPVASTAPATTQQQQRLVLPSLNSSQQSFGAPLATLNSQMKGPPKHTDELRRAFEEQARAEGLVLTGTASASASASPSGSHLLEKLAEKPPAAKKANNKVVPTLKRSRTDEDKAAGTILLGFLSSLRESYLDAVNENQKQEREEGQSSSSGTMSSSNLQGHTALSGTCTIPTRIATVTDSASSQQGSVEDYDWSSERKSDSSEESDKEVQVKEQRRGPPRKRHKKRISRNENC